MLFRSGELYPRLGALVGHHTDDPIPPVMMNRDLRTPRVEYMALLSLLRPAADITVGEAQRVLFRPVPESNPQVALELAAALSATLPANVSMMVAVSGAVPMTMEQDVATHYAEGKMNVELDKELAKELLTGLPMSHADYLKRVEQKAKQEQKATQRKKGKERVRQAEGEEEETESDGEDSEPPPPPKQPARLTRTELEEANKEVEEEKFRSLPGGAGTPIPWRIDEDKIREHQRDVKARATLKRKEAREAAAAAAREEQRTRRSSRASNQPDRYGLPSSPGSKSVASKQSSPKGKSKPKGPLLPDPEPEE